MYYVDMENSIRNIETINFVPIKKVKEGRFKTLEILTILSVIAMIALFALLIINPSKEAAEARNMKRSADISSILSLVSAHNNQYGIIHAAIPKSEVCVSYGNEICKTGSSNCTDLVDMTFLNDENSEKLVVMPQDPLFISINGTGYYISQNQKGYVTVCAPHAERNEKISFSKLMY
jgi:hypothetical protein